ncbi:titin isoform X2 [Cylas formicarius]|uniref:titin isoform X2 n=1 Tax=Cylas formicarius TaxID=197179 RepID=UPI0029589B9D|nr:titin isoform X2 [Cylas formicarius]
MWILVAVLLVGIADCGRAIQRYAGTKTRDMYAHVGTIAELPCRVDRKQCGNLHSVKWYKDTSRIYVLSHAGSIKRPEGDAKERMQVEYPSSGGEAVLKISDVRVEDEAIYKCEITYLEVRESCDVVQIVNLTTLIKPEVVRIIGVDGASMANASILGPKNLGDEVDLVCEAGIGKPIPRISWYNGSTLINRAQYTANAMGDGVGTGRSKLQLTLGRGDLNARFECRVESEALDEPIISWITADVHVPPTKMELSGVKNHVVQGTNVLLICDVHGAKPAATVRWTNGSVPITDQSLVQSSPEDNSQITTKVIYDERDGTYTTKSQLVFQASHWENGIKIHCYAENEVIKKRHEPEMHRLLILEVRYPPVISVRPKNITVTESTENSRNGNGTLLICSYKANPQELKGALWSKDGKNLTLSDSSKYQGGTIENPPLIIYNVTREDMGDYSCWLKNEVGSDQSEDSIFLNVQYPPDVEILMDPPAPVKAQDKINVLLECNVTSGNPSTLLKVRWFLDGELMKEFPECNYTAKDESGGPFCGLDPSILSLERVDESFAGNYTCQGENTAGWGPLSEPVELIVYYPPSPARLISTPKDKVVKGGMVTLECKVNSYGRPDNVTYKWYRGSHQLTEVNSSVYKISPVGLETRSNFTCIAVNDGGESEPATKFINVTAPPALFDRLKPYQGILYSSQHINLTCRVECFPLCNIVWRKDGRIINAANDPLYDNRIIIHPPDRQKNFFESIESTLIWNMTAWPGGKLNKTAPNANYSCQSESNDSGPGVESMIEIAVDYPPEDVKVSSTVVNVIEGQAPSPVKCHGKGLPTLEYKWKKNTTSEPIETSDVLRLGSMDRKESGSYICEAFNKHGLQQAIVYFNVKYAPECTITRTDRGGNPALLCTVVANPQQVVFTWKAKEGNETYVVNSNIETDGLKSFLVLDSSVDTRRTYQCFANNSVGFSDKQPCEMSVDGILPWWKRLNHENLIIIIASIVAIIICVIIICIVIIVLCRRKRANTKYNNPLEMEERENPDQDSSPLDGSKWPLKPGLLVQVNKMNNVSISRLSPPSSSPRNTTKTSAYLRLRRNKSKVYARIKRLRAVLGLGGDEAATLGIKAGAGGVVTFKKMATSPPSARSATVNPRKRKKPGDAPPLNQSSTGDKIRTGVAAPVGNMQDHPHAAHDPNDKGFYENLPFHGMQNPPNKPISVIAPFQQCAKRAVQTDQKPPPKMPDLEPLRIRRNQSFHGFQTNPGYYTPRFLHPFNLPLARNLSNPFINSPPFNYPRYHAYWPPTPSRPSIIRPSNFRVSPPMRTQEPAIRTDEAKALPKTKRVNLSERKFGSLKTEKHKCYSPTFYSMRCKKHAKKRPIVYALPKKCLSPLSKSTAKDFQNLTDSIQILEEATPKPAPRCRKHRKPEIIYANICNSLQGNVPSGNSPDSSNGSEEGGTVSVTEAQIHVSTVEVVESNERTAETDRAKKVVPTIAAQAIKNSPVLKVSPNFIKPKVESPKGALSLQILAKRKASPVQAADKSQKDENKENETGTVANDRNPVAQHAFYTLTASHCKKPACPPQYSATIPHQKHTKLIPKALFQDQLAKSKSFSSKSSKQKRHFQIPLQKCHSFKFQTAESYFQPIKNIHEENLMRNGYLRDYPSSTSLASQRSTCSRRKRERPKQKTKGPLVLMRPNDYQENVEFQEKVQSSVLLQYPQPMIAATGRVVVPPAIKQNGVVQYADLDMPSSRKSSHDSSSTSSSKSKKHKPKTEYATLKFNDIGQEIDV